MVILELEGHSIMFNECPIQNKECYEVEHFIMTPEFKVIINTLYDKIKNGYVVFFYGLKEVKCDVYQFNRDIILQGFRSKYRIGIVSDREPNTFYLWYNSIITAHNSLEV